MNRHITIKTSCSCVVELRNSPAIKRMPRPELEPEAEHFNRNLFAPDLIRGFLTIDSNKPAAQ